MEKLPTEIALEIFYRLPPDSVVRCKFVCKSWCNLLLLLSSSSGDSNNFANINLLRHRHYQQRNSTLSFIGLQKNIIRSDKDDHDHYVNGRRCGGKFYITEYDEEKLNCKVKTIKLPDHIGISWNSGDLKLAGSCNGLLCLPRTYDQMSSSSSNLLLVKDRICICNPLLNEYVPLPLSDLQLFKYASVDPTDNMVIGFGHHPSTDEYKVVRVYYPHSNSNIGDVEVYTLGKNSMWRSKGTINYRLRTWSPPVFINGSLHWLTRVDDHDFVRSLARIVSFNLEAEEFHVIPDVPQVPNHYYYNGMSELKELGGCLCLIHKGENLMDIWAWKQDYMNNNNNKEYSWVKEFGTKWRKEKRNNSSYSPCAIIKKRINGDHLFLMWCDRKKLVCYDSKTRNFEYVVRERSRQVLNQPWRIQPSDRNPIIHINSVISLKALGEDAQLYSSSVNHLKRKATHQEDMGIKTRCTTIPQSRAL